ncbi:dickkopf-related protein 1b [Centroberyx gerrardi]|uniref:dickkopf-related protein 1b n=1 Tax=Centroberyx gerrardi TaxID=166262 RepID=UPI003AAA76AF
MLPAAVSLLAVCVLGSVGSVGSVGSSSLVLNSNAIKNPGGEPEDLDWTENHNLLLDPIQSLSCSADADCGESGFCFASRGSCLPCRRRRKRCTHDSMCCHGNRCSNGVCLPLDSDLVQQFVLEEMGPTVTISSDTSSSITSSITSNLQDQDLTLTPRGLEGERCLRSSDCSDGLCCARHFWSKICKPVLRDGQVCTKRRKKGALGLEIFQRCDCGAGLACRTQSGAEPHRLNKAARSLHTCQQH